ncbi:hypothetical protein [Ruminococcus flavefaciens]|uniref:Uncharacterized protein n=1 Tax=Ruminococcus flavefaciens 007c TaxID=1341157 RepID=W7UPS6_RUMFL|nr:hypothetical protein [Ruminococcus flavefaciens]EWM53454.1 hypothetical protein RF007C_07165 [Ruminococcus flavefaciens 007c]
MDDIMSRINELLSDEESIKRLSELADMLSSAESSDSSNSGDESGDSVSPDISSVLKLTSLIGSAANEDRNTELLLALKPHLGAEKQKRVDKAVKLIKLMAVWNIAKDSGLLQELI